MERFWKLLYYYCLGGFVISVVYLTVMLFISPRQDALKRGFIPCTEKLVIDISSCQRGKISCPLMHLWQDMKCNGSVVLGGFGAWVKGEQSTPWENYLFEPKAFAEIDEETPYIGNVSSDMDDMEKQRLFIEAKHTELEEIKNRQLQLNENVIMSAPEAQIPSQDVKAIKKHELISEKAGDINDEAFDETEWAENSEGGEHIQPQKDTLEKLKQKTSEQLSKEEMKYEK